MKQFILIAVLLFSAGKVCAQEVFTDTITGKEYLFLGSLSPNGKKAKVLENGQIHWKELEAMEQTGRLETPAFLEKLFSCNLQFRLEGYEPFWAATLTKNEVSFTNFTTNNVVVYPITISVAHSLGNQTYFMFSSPTGNIFGVIYGNNLTSSANQHYCEFNIPEDENPLYCSFLSVENKAYKGCITLSSQNNNEKDTQ